MKKYKPIFFIVFIALVVYLSYHFQLHVYFSDMQKLAFLQNMVQENIWLAMLVYCAITIFAGVFLALPGVLYAVLAGMLFGPVLGTLLCAFSASVGAVFCFIAARYFLKDSIAPKLMKNTYIKKYLFDQKQNNMFFILMITRLVPLFPFNLQNFAYGITDISLGLYSIGTFIFIIPGTAIYTFGTAGIVDGGNRLLYIVTALVLALVVTIVGKQIQKRYM
ncbi:MAG: TVP38/TMEM64 family protein [Eubacteriales bacterium]|nr:TVP38/TMEM64 family protein [Eubacteriales bacterium]